MYQIILYFLLPSLTFVFVLVGCSDDKKNDTPTTVASTNPPVTTSATNKSTTTNNSPQFVPQQNGAQMPRKVDSDDKIAQKKTGSKEEIPATGDNDAEDGVKMVSMKGGKKQGSVMVTARRAASKAPSCKPSKMKKSGEEGDSGYEMCPTLTPEQLKKALE